MKKSGRPKIVEKGRKRTFILPFAMNESERKKLTKMWMSSPYNSIADYIRHRLFYD